MPLFFDLDGGLYAKHHPFREKEKKKKGKKIG
jgi:hypothetical protein